jgi:predicted enzyme related to lactoylglutathione lyase
MEIQVNIDCSDPESLAQWYCDALGYRPEGAAGQYRSIMPEAGTNGPKLIFQQVSEPKGPKNRMHLDLIVGPDFEKVAEQFVQLGAQRLSAQPVVEHGCQWIVMLDPEGNELCLCSQ